ncbi:MAG: zinc ribbon domain-containing protein [Thermoplasmata archaeon]|nr:zinc ribbon domain-containing protein [Thermoplasmata archaeon]
MNCSGCGAVVPTGDNACPACGRPVMIPPPAAGASPRSPIKKMASTTVETTRAVASDVKKGGKELVGEMKIAVRDVGTLTRKVVDELGKGLEIAGKDLQKATKKGK